MASITTDIDNNNNNDSNTIGSVRPVVLTRQLTGVLDNSSNDATYDFDSDFSSSDTAMRVNTNDNGGVFNSSAGKATTPVKDNNENGEESLNFRWGGIKDEGVAGKENQDDFLG